MAEAVLFADATAVVVAILEAADLGPVHSKVPRDRKVPFSTFSTVRRTGGPRRDVVTDEAQITVESWAPEESDAHDLAQLSRQAINAARGTVVAGVPVYSVVETAGPGVLSDPLSGQPRYSQTFIVALRGV